MLDVCVGSPPRWNGGTRQSPAGVKVRRRVRLSAPSTITVTRSALERLQIGGQGSAVHCQQGEHMPMLAGSGRLSDISSENWPLVSPSGLSAAPRPCCPLQMQAQAGVPHLKGNLKRQILALRHVQ
jgi:hypothetical protein